MKGELSVVSKQKQYSSNKVPILVEGDIATDMEEVKKFLHIMILDGYKKVERWSLTITTSAFITELVSAGYPLGPFSTQEMEKQYNLLLHRSDIW